MKPLVYVAGPYQHPDPVENTHVAIRAGMTLVESGLVAVIVPHLSLLAHVVQPRDVEYWYNMDLDQLAHCDALVRLEGESKGADEEVRFANTHGIPVYYDIAELLDDVRGGKVEARRVNVELLVEEKFGAPRSIEEALEQIRAVFARKNHDYAGEAKDWANNFVEAGTAAGVDAGTACEVMIGVKQSRLRALHGREAANESRADTVLDRAVYAIIAYALTIEGRGA